MTHFPRIALALLLVSLPIHAADLGSPVPVAPLQFDRAFGNQTSPRIASNGGVSLTTWVTGNDLYDSPLAESGTPLRVPPLRIGSTYFGNDLTDGPDGFLTAWTGSEPTGQSHTYIRKIASDGTPGVQREISVPCGGKVNVLGNRNSYLFVSSDCAVGVDLLDADGNVKTSAQFDGSWVTRNAIERDGDGYLLATALNVVGSTKYTELLLRTVAADGTISEPLRVPMDGTPAMSLGMARSTNETLLVWGSEFGLRAQRLDARLAPIETAIPVRYDDASVERVIAIGDVFWILTRGAAGDLSLARIRGGELETDRVPLSYSSSGGDIALQSGRLVAVWSEAGDIRSAVLDPVSAAVESSAPVSTSARGQLNPDVTFDGSSFVAAWQETTGDSDLIAMRRFDATAEAVDREPIVVSDARRHGSHPAVASNGSVSLVVWLDHDGSDVIMSGRRILPNGQPAEPQPFVIGFGIDPDARPRLASDGHDFLLVWKQHAKGLAMQIHGDAATSNAPVTLSDPGAADGDPDVVWDGSNYVVVWATHFDSAAGAFSLSAIRAALLSPDARLRERRWIVTSQNADTDPSAALSSPRIAWSGRAHLIVFHAWRGLVAITMESVAATANLTGRRRPILPEQGVALSFAAMDRSASVTWDGTAFVASWTEMHFANTLVVEGARIAENPRYPDDIEAFEVGSESPRIDSTTAVAGGAGTAMFAFARYQADEPVSGAPRVYVRAAR